MPILPGLLFLIALQTGSAHADDRPAGKSARSAGGPSEEEALYRRWTLQSDAEDSIEDGRQEILRKMKTRFPNSSHLPEMMRDDDGGGGDDDEEGDDADTTVADTLKATAPDSQKTAVGGKPAGYLASEEEGPDKTWSLAFSHALEFGNGMGTGSEMLAFDSAGLDWERELGSGTLTLSAEALYGASLNLESWNDMTADFGVAYDRKRFSVELSLGWDRGDQFYLEWNHALLTDTVSEDHPVWSVTLAQGIPFFAGWNDSVELSANGWGREYGIAQAMTRLGYGPRAGFEPFVEGTLFYQRFNSAGPSCWDEEGVDSCSVELRPRRNLGWQIQGGLEKIWSRSALETGFRYQRNISDLIAGPGGKKSREQRYTAAYVSGRFALTEAIALQIQGEGGYETDKGGSGRRIGLIGAGMVFGL